MAQGGNSPFSLISHHKLARLGALLITGLMGSESLVSGPTVSDLSTNYCHLDRYVLDALRLNLKRVLGNNGKVPKLAHLKGPFVLFLKGNPGRMRGIQLKCLPDAYPLCWIGMIDGSVHADQRPQGRDRAV